MSTLNSTTAIVTNPREQRGLRIADRYQLKPNGTVWMVPSESSNTRYRVDPETGRCSCPDSEARRVKCKHQFAVEFTIRREAIRVEETVTLNGQSATKVTETVKETKTARVTYKQDWPAYNAAQTAEKSTFLALLHDLCRGIAEPVQTMGRPRLPLADMVFSAAYKVYSGFSGRRFMSDLSDAHERGYLSRLPHYNSMFNYLDDEALTPILKNLIATSSLPLKAIESDFAVDATGFGTSGTVTWFNKRYGHEQDNSDWLKVHLMCGVTTNIVTSAEVTSGFAHDAPHLPALVETTAQNFTLREVSADKAYASVRNLEAVAATGATPYIAFKSNATGDGGGSALWQRMWGFYTYKRDEFLAHYHRRSNIESTNQMIKAKFGGKLRSKSAVGQINEALCKVLCHNLCVVIQSVHELGIAPTFWPADAVVSA